MTSKLSEEGLGPLTGALLHGLLSTLLRKGVVTREELIAAIEEEAGRKAELNAPAEVMAVYEEAVEAIQKLTV